MSEHSDEDRVSVSTAEDESVINRPDTEINSQSHQETEASVVTTESESAVSSLDIETDSQFGKQQQLSRSTWWLAKWISTFTFLFVAIVAVILPALICISKTSGIKDPFGCDAAGNVWVAGISSNTGLGIWKLSYVLYPTVPISNTSFRNAKAIDICWDVLVGRGYSALSGLVVYRVFRIVLTHSVKTKGLSQEQILAVEYRTTSASALWTYLEGCVRRIKRPSRRKQSPAYKTALGLATLAAYVLITPTWLSAMTSYQAIMYPVLEVNNSLVSFQNLQQCSFRIHNASRLNLNDSCIPLTGELHDAMEKYIRTLPVVQCYGELRSIGGAAQYLEVIHTPDFNEIAPNFNFAHLRRKSCNHDSVFEHPDGSIPVSSPVPDIEGIQYSNGTKPLEPSYLAKHGSCQVSSDDEKYVWGFSFILLFGFVVATALLTIYMTFIWAQYFNLVWPQQVDFIFGDMRTALVVAESIKEGYCDNIAGLSEIELKDILSRSGPGVQHIHARSEIMSIPGPAISRAEEPDTRFPVGSHAYNEYLRNGYVQSNHA